MEICATNLLTEVDLEKLWLIGGRTESYETKTLTGSRLIQARWLWIAEQEGIGNLAQRKGIILDQSGKRMQGLAASLSHFPWYVHTTLPFTYPREPRDLHHPKQKPTSLVNVPGLCQAATKMARETGRPRSVFGTLISASILEHYEIPKFHLRWLCV